MVAEEYRIGGTCVIRGCVPKKLLVYAAAYQARDRGCRRLRLDRRRRAFDWQTLVANKDKEIARLEEIYTANVEKTGAKIVQDPRRARGSAHGAAETGESRHREIHPDRDRGAPNHGPAFPGIEHVITSNEVFELDELPKRIVIQGGGYIAVEFAGIFAGYGPTHAALPRRQHAARLRRGGPHAVLTEMEKQGITILTGCTVDRIDEARQRIHRASSNGSRSRPIR